MIDAPMQALLMAIGSMKEDSPCPAFDPADPLALLTTLTETERAIAESAAAFCKKELQPRIRDAFRHEKFDREVFPLMGAAGFFGATLPEPYGPGLSATAYGLIARAVEGVDSAYRSTLSVQSSLVMKAIYSFGSDAQKKEWLPKLAAGTVIGAFGLTEPDGGSDPAAMKTRAVLTAQGYVLNGSKAWISHAPVADIFVIWAKDTAAEKIRGFLVPRGAPGLSAPPIEGKFSLRASLTGSIFLDDVLVPAEAVLPDIYGLRGPFTCLNAARTSIVWGMAGAAESCWRTALDYVQTRPLFGGALAGKQIIQLRLAEMQTLVAVNQMLAFRLGRLEEAGQLVPEAISLAKRTSTGNALQVARMARDMLGGNGISDEYPIIRHLVNLESVHTYEGTADVHALVLGRAMTGISAF